jgi:AcrR family transcriptional regulator
MAKSPTGKSTALSRDRIVKAAYQLARKDPLNALSMRKIATRLKVTPMAIYKHFSDKNELTAAVIDMQMEESRLVPEDLDQNDWRGWILESYLRMRDTYDAAPGMLHYMTHATVLGPSVLHWQNETLKVLINAGLTPKQAITAQAAMAELAAGSAILVPIRRQGMEKVFPTVWKDLKEGKAPDLAEASKAGVSPVDYPWVVLCGQAMLEDMQDSRAAFVTELNLFLDGLEKQIAGNLKSHT